MWCQWWWHRGSWRCHWWWYKCPQYIGKYSAKKMGSKIDKITSFKLFSDKKAYFSNHNLRKNIHSCLNGERRKHSKYNQPDKGPGSGLSLGSIAKSFWENFLNKYVHKLSSLYLVLKYSLQILWKHLEFSWILPSLKLFF